MEKALSVKDNFPLVKFLVENGAIVGDGALIHCLGWGSSTSVEILKYLVEKGKENSLKIEKNLKKIRKIRKINTYFAIISIITYKKK